MAMIKHNYPQSQHTGMIPVGSTFAPEPAQPNQQQMLAQALRGRNAMPQQQFTEEEQAIIMQLIEQNMQQGMNQDQAKQQAIQQLMSMKSG
jgi:ABC-type glycerol-3-phosphate transport system substrate-binding protein